MAHTRPWNKITPLDSDNAGYGAAEIRTKMDDIEDRLLINHVWGESIDYDGEHLSDRVVVITGSSSPVNINLGNYQPRVIRINLGNGIGAVQLNITTTSVSTDYSRRFLLLIKQGTETPLNYIVFPSNFKWHNNTTVNIVQNA